jgi:NADP-dependent 3-hydroxy acid dehydrogenase YdfG
MERFLKIPATVVLMVWVAVIGATFPAKVSAQVLYGSITGTVTDESGAVVPAAKVVVVNENTGLRREVTTDTVGIYTVVGNTCLGSFGQIRSAFGQRIVQLGAVLRF